MSTTTRHDTRETLRAYYESTRRSDEHEPRWVHPFYEPVLGGALLNGDHEQVARHMLRGKVTREEFAGSARVIDTDGWKVGTTTWIFLRRKLCTPVSYGGWTIISATFERETFWLAYSADRRVGASTFTDESIGPCRSVEEVKTLVNEFDASAKAAEREATEFLDRRQALMNAHSDEILAVVEVVNASRLPRDPMIVLVDPKDSVGSLFTTGGVFASQRGGRWPPDRPFIDVFERYEVARRAGHLFAEHVERALTERDQWLLCIAYGGALAIKPTIRGVNVTLRQPEVGPTPALPAPARWLARNHRDDGPPSSHEDLVRAIVVNSLPMAASYGLFDVNNLEQLAVFGKNFETVTRTVVARQVAGDDDVPRIVKASDLDSPGACEAAVDIVVAEKLWELLWASCGFPHVAFANPKSVATYAFMGAPRSIVGELHCPWPAFAIELQVGDLPIADTYVRRVAVAAPSEITGVRWRIVSHLASGRHLDDLVSDLTDSDEPTPANDLPDTFRADPETARMALVVRRIVANVMLAITNQDNYVHRVRTLGQKGSFQRRMARLPQTSEYVLGRNLKVALDLRDELREYVSRGGPAKKRGPVTVQTLVVGHGKWQVYGPGRTGRKWIFVQPYWRGPEDAPIVVRPHVFIAKPDPDDGGEKQ